MLQPSHRLSTDLCGSNDTIRLHSINSLIREGSAEVGVDREGFPISSSRHNSAHASNRRSKGHVHTLLSELGSQRDRPSMSQISIPTALLSVTPASWIRQIESLPRPDRDSTGEPTDEIRRSNTLARIIQT